MHLTVWQLQSVTFGAAPCFPAALALSVIASPSTCWTAQMYLIFSAGRPDVLPIGDLGVRKGIQICFGLRVSPPGLVIVGLCAPLNSKVYKRGSFADGRRLSAAALGSTCIPACSHARIFQKKTSAVISVQELPDVAKMEALTASWRPWRSIGSWYMWRLTEAEGKRSPKKPAKRPAKAALVTGCSVRISDVSRDSDMAGTYEDELHRADTLQHKTEWKQTGP